MLLQPVISQWWARAAARIRARSPQSQLLPWIVLILGFAASIFLFAALRAAVEDVARLRFERQASDAKSVIESRIHAYSDVLYGLQGLFATHASVSRLQFHRFVKSLDLKNRYPGFDVVNFAAYVLARDVDEFISSVRRDTSVEPAGYPAFSIRPPGQRDEYFVVAYLEPMKGYEFAFGRDLGANPQVSEPEALVSALHLARDTGRLTASGVPIRISAGKEYVGLALRLPVYRLGMPVDTVEQRRRAYVGSVGAGFNIEALMKGVLPEKTLEQMRFALFDVGAAGTARKEVKHRRLLFDSNELVETSARAAVSGDPAETFAHSLAIEVGGRLWEVAFHAPKKSAIDRVDMFFPWLVLTGGLVLSALLCGVLFSLGSSRTRAMKIASDMTKELLESRALLSDAQKLAQLGCCQYSPVDGRFIWSEELYRIHGVDRRSFTPTYETHLNLVHPADRAAWEQSIADALHTGGDFSTEFRIVRPDGSVRHVRSLGEVIADNSGRPARMLWAALDITEQKEIEQTLRASAEQLTALSRGLVKVQETERRQLSRELHDRVGQNLTALSINLDILRTSLTNDRYAEQHARIDDSSRLLESTVDSIQNVMSELRPPMLDDYGLLPALHWYTKDFAHRTGIDVRVVGSDEPERLAPDVEITLFRVAQEALTNVAKHAHASHVEIALAHSENHCTMTVTDDGIGIESSGERHTEQRSSLGIVTMRERVQAIGGRFLVCAMPTGGTQIAIEIP